MFLHLALDSSSGIEYASPWISDFHSFSSHTHRALKLMSDVQLVSKKGIEYASPWISNFHLCSYFMANSQGTKTGVWCSTGVQKTIKFFKKLTRHTTKKAWLTSPSGPVNKLSSPNSCGTFAEHQQHINVWLQIVIANDCIFAFCNLSR